jgi:spectinomycin phosphotransferase
MLEKPAIPDELILTGVRQVYGLPIERLAFLPLGVDVHSAVYRLEAAGGAAYFLKLRMGHFNPLSVSLPLALSSQGVPAILAPLKTHRGQGWGSLDERQLILYPFIEGQDGYQAALTRRQWVEFGAALSGIHQAQVPPELASQLRHEDFDPRWREQVRVFQSQVEETRFTDPVSTRLADFMRQRRQEIHHLLSRADSLSAQLSQRQLEAGLCHADMHPGNLLVSADGRLFIVDWDDAMLAPKERDLVFIDGGVGEAADWTPEAALFYQGYGAVQVDRAALAYYRYERIVQDIAAFCQEILLTEGGGEDREQGYRYFISNFKPGGDYARAVWTDAFETG